VVPRRYDLVLEPDLDSFTFRGSLDVSVEVVAQSSRVVLNAADLEVTAGAWLDAGDVPEPAVDITYDTKLEQVTLHFDKPIPSGPCRLRIEFTGILNDQLCGFYRSSFVDSDGGTRVLATTQFEPTYARRAFPCWDEPDLKAVFGVALVVPEHLTAISCAPVTEIESLPGDRRLVRFADTMPLSTYLLAFVVGELEATAVREVDGIPLRIYHPPGLGHLAGFALEAGSHALGYLARYFDIPYPGEKLDMIAIPDFASGAMENLGAITFRESLLLIDASRANHFELSRRAAVIAHEIAHMWFGDLVTMRWWNGTWLKEAFATFMELKTSDAFRPEWKTWLAFSTARDEALEIDGLAATRSIEYPVHSPADAAGMFDTITYEKGSAVLRMLEQFLGETVFRDGIRRYLQHHAFGNTETRDLWDALEAVSDQPVRSIAEGWIFQEGFPEVVVEPWAGGTRISARQFRYLGGGDGTWTVPVRYRRNGVEDRVLVDRPVVIPAGGGVVANAGGTGFYRTRYEPSLHEAHAAHLPSMLPAERFAFVADTWAMTLAGSASILDLLQLIARLGGEREPTVWRAALTALDEVDRVVAAEDRSDVHRFTADLIRPAASALGWTPEDLESDLDRRLRGLLLTALGTLGGDPETIERARSIAEQWIADPQGLDGDVAVAVLMIAAANGGPDDFERYLAARAGAANPQDEVRLLRAAAMVPSDATAVALLEMVLDGTVRRQDAYWVVALLLGHRVTGPAVWRTAQPRWDQLVAAMPPQNAWLMLEGIHHRSEPGIADQVRSTLMTHPIPGGERITAQHCERLEIRVALRRRESKGIGPAIRTLTKG
jgi:puromycin-sensitive aminopeptidase